MAPAAMPEFCADSETRPICCCSSPVPVAASLTARAISVVAASCSVTAAAMVLLTWLICSMVLATSAISPAAAPVDCWIELIWAEISSVALAVCVGEVLHLGRHHRKALAGFTRTCRFDGGIEGQQIGLAGDVVDERHHRADLFERGDQSIDQGHRAVRLAGGLGRDGARIIGLLADLADRGREFFNRRGDRRDILGNLAPRSC